MAWTIECVDLITSYSEWTHQSGDTMVTIEYGGADGGRRTINATRRGLTAMDLKAIKHLAECQLCCNENPNAEAPHVIQYPTQAEVDAATPPSAWEKRLKP